MAIPSKVVLVRCRKVIHLSVNNRLIDPPSAQHNHSPALSRISVSLRVSGFERSVIVVDEAASPWGATPATPLPLAVASVRLMPLTTFGTEPHSPLSL